MGEKRLLSILAAKKTLLQINRNIYAASPWNQYGVLVYEVAWKPCQGILFRQQKCFWRISLRITEVKSVREYRYALKFLPVKEIYVSVKSKTLVEVIRWTHSSSKIVDFIQKKRLIFWLFVMDKKHLETNCILPKILLKQLRDKMRHFCNILVMMDEGILIKLMLLTKYFVKYDVHMSDHVYRYNILASIKKILKVSFKK